MSIVLRLRNTVFISDYVNNDALKSKKIHFIFETLEVYMNPEMKKHLLILWCFGFLVFFSMHIYIIVNKMTCLEVLICNSFYLIVPQESCPCHSGLFYNMVFDDCIVFHCMDVMLFITFFPDCRIFTFSNFIYHSQCFDESWTFRCLSFVKNYAYFCEI